MTSLFIRFRTAVTDAGSLRSWRVDANDGITATAAFILGALIPLLITILVPGNLEAWAILFAVMVSLVLTSIVSTRRGRLSAWRTIARSLTVGVGALGVSYLVGLLIF